MQAEAYYRAIKERDSRFDGKFFFAVATTGIYCRPVCPARTPKQMNVAYFKTARAAEAAGYRACKRCRPEAAPGTAAWSGTQAVVARALKLIAADRAKALTVKALAEKLGVGERHLYRLFMRHLGRGPKAVMGRR